MTQTQKLLSSLVSINSQYPNEQKISQFLTNWLVEHGFKIKHVAVGDRQNILATRGESAQILFYGHMDTVQLSPSNSWNTDPFKLTEIEGRLYGLGSYDMKGGIASFLTAATDTNTPLKIMLAVDEENISEGSWAVMHSNASFFEGLKLIISSEPNFDLGLSGITTSRTGRVIYSLEFAGKAEHIAKYQDAVDAISLFGSFATRLYATRRSLANSDKTVIQIRSVQAQANGMSVCDLVTAEAEVLLGAEDSIENIQKKLSSLGKVKVSVKPRITPYLTGYQFSDFAFQVEIEKIIKTETGNKTTYHHRSSVGDDNVLATLGIPVITWGPDGGNAHKGDEYVSAQSLDLLTKMYTKLLKTI